MNSRVGFAAYFFRQGDVLDYLTRYPESRKNKKVFELLIAWLICQFLPETEKVNYLVGFRTVDSLKASPDGSKVCLKDIVNGTIQVDDTDVDFLIARPDLSRPVPQRNSLIVKFQLVRYTYRRDVTLIPDLIELIKRKCRKYSRDSSLHLVVAVEKTPQITVDDLHSLLANSEIPFGQILLVLKPEENPAEFMIQVIYPEIVASKRITIPLEL